MNDSIFKINSGYPEAIAADNYNVRHIILIIRIQDLIGIIDNKRCMIMLYFIQ